MDNNPTDKNFWATQARFLAFAEAQQLIAHYWAELSAMALDETLMTEITGIPGRGVEFATRANTARQIYESLVVLSADRDGCMTASPSV